MPTATTAATTATQPQKSQLRKSQKSGAATSSADVTRREDVIEFVRLLESAITDWQANDDPALFVNFRGQSRKRLSYAIEEAATALFEAASTTQAERLAWPIILAVDALEAQMIDFATAYEADPGSVTPDGPASLWSAWEKVLQHAARPPKVFKLESIADLRAAKVSPQNICLMYGFTLGRDASGNPIPDFDKLDDEAQNPGKYTSAESGFLPPEERKYWEPIEAEWQRRCEELSARNESTRAAASKAPREFKPAPETIEELVLLPGMTAEQICRMKYGEVDEKRVEEIHAIAAAMSTVLNEATAIPVSEKDRGRAREMAAHRAATESRRIDALNRHDEHGQDYRRRIVSMAADGCSATDIVAALSPFFPSVTIETTRATVREAIETNTASRETVAAK